MFEYQKRWQLPQLPIAQENWDILQTQHGQVTRNAERHLREHRMRIRMPEGEPGPQRLTDVNHQDRDRPAVADEANHYGSVQDGSQLRALQDIDQKSCKECARS